MKSDNKSGKLGEIYAAKYLSQNGYDILETNYKNHIAEIDIIAQDKCGTLCFVEVKTRKNKLHGCGTDFVFKSKMQKMVLGARSYLVGKYTDCDIRFDIIEIYGEILPSGFLVSEVNHIKNAFDV